MNKQETQKPVEILQYLKKALPEYNNAIEKNVAAEAFDIHTKLNELITEHNRLLIRVKKLEQINEIKGGKDE